MQTTLRGRQIGAYSPDTMSRSARRAVEAARDYGAWRQRQAAGLPVGGMVDIAEQCARWRASEVIAVGVQ